MNRLLPLLLVPILLTGCQTPGVTIPVGHPQVVTSTDGKPKVVPASAIKINADVMGDIESPLFSLKTPKDSNGNFAYTEIPVTMKDGTVVITRQPMTAQIKTASVWDAIFSGVRGITEEVGGWAAAIVGFNKLAPVGQSAVNAAFPTP